MKKQKRYSSEAELCAEFQGWAKSRYPEIEQYTEWMGWDLLLVYPEGWQLGIQAKLRLNAEVVLQAIRTDWPVSGPDYRAILVPELNGWAQVADRLGLVVFRPHNQRWQSKPDFAPNLTDSEYRSRVYWVDWNPATRHSLPPVPTDAIAGSPSPVSLTPWKLKALEVLAELETKGTITTKRIRQLGINSARWTQERWLEPAEKRGDWKRSDRCPAFEKQHPTVYAAILDKVKGTSG